MATADQLAESLVAGRRLDLSIAEAVRRREARIREESKQANGDTALVALLCDAVRLAREYTDACAGKSDREALAAAQAALAQTREALQAAAGFFGPSRRAMAEGRTPQDARLAELGRVLDAALALQQNRAALDATIAEAIRDSEARAERLREALSAIATEAMISAIGAVRRTQVDAIVSPLLNDDGTWREPAHASFAIALAEARRRGAREAAGRLARKARELAEAFSERDREGWKARLQLVRAVEAEAARIEADGKEGA